MRALSTAAVLIATVTAAAAATDAELKTMIVGHWADTDSCSDGALVFNADGTFVSQAPDGSPPDDNLTGTYTIMDGKLAGKAGAIEMPTVPIKFDGMKLLMGSDPSADVLVPCK
jgi:hypothetical protein